MFVNLSSRRTLRDSATVDVIDDISVGTLVDTTAGGLIGVLTTTGRTAGTVIVQAQGSIDNNTWFDLPAEFATTINANGIAYIELQRAIPKFVRFQLTPGGGFDGSVKLDVRSDSRVIAA